MRTKHECRMLTAMIAEMKPVHLALLFGILTGEYQKHPNSLFWEVLERFEKGNYNPLDSATLIYK